MTSFQTLTVSLARFQHLDYDPNYARLKLYTSLCTNLWRNDRLMTEVLKSPIHTCQGGGVGGEGWALSSVNRLPRQMLVCHRRPRRLRGPGGRSETNLTIACEAGVQEANY